MLNHQGPYRTRELVGRERALELGLDPTIPADEKRERLTWKPPLPCEDVETSPRVVPTKWLDMDETNAGAQETATNGIDDVDDRTARAVRAELRGREDNDEGLTGD